MQGEEILTAPEVATVLHIGKNAVYELAKSGELASYRMGRKLLFKLSDVEAYMASKRLAKENVALAEGHAALPEEARDTEFAIGGMGIPVSLLIERLSALGTSVEHRALASYDALHAMYEGRCDAALVHLYDQRTNAYNIPYVQRLVPGCPVVVFRIAQRWQGFVVAKGNPKRIASWGALLREDTRLANRVRGCGSRILLDEKLLAMEARGETIRGYKTEYATGLLAAQAVSIGAADVAVAGIRIPAQMRDVDFVPLQQEWLDLVVAKGEATRALIAHVRGMLDDHAFRDEYCRIIHGDAKSFGAIVYEC